MQTTLEFIDATKKRLNIESDYALAPALGLSRGAVSRYRRLRDCLGDETAVKIAAILNLSPGYVLACVAAERAKLSSVRAAWADAARTLQNTAAAFLIGVFTLPLIASPSANSIADAVLCILCQIGRRRLTLAFLALLAIFSVNTAKAGESWGRETIALEAIYQLTAAADWAQTRWIATHPVADHGYGRENGQAVHYVTNYAEVNPLLGARPSLGRVNAYFMIAGVAHALITDSLPPRYRPLWQMVSIGIEAGFVTHNARIGVHFNF